MKKIHRPVREDTNSGHIDDAKGRELFSSTRDGSYIQEAVACINHAPALARVMRMALDHLEKSSITKGMRAALDAYDKEQRA